MVNKDEYYLLTVTVTCTFHFDCDITVMAMCDVGFCRNEFES